MKKAFLALSLICIVVSPALAQQETAAQKAEKLYETAISQYYQAHYDQAMPLLDQFIRLYGNSQHAPVAYLQLATCKQQLKDPNGCDTQLDLAIQRFGGSAAWWCAYKAKMDQAKGRKDFDKYLSVLETMVRAQKDIPLDLNGSINRVEQNYLSNEYMMSSIFPFEPDAALMRSVVDINGWVLELIDVADTPERAQKALKAISATLKDNAKDLPTDWQFTHVELLKKAGQADEAQRAWKKYADDWGDDPRAIGLWLLAARYQDARKQDEDAAKTYEYLFKTFKGYDSLEWPLYNHIYQVSRTGNYAQFASQAREYLKVYNEVPRIIGVMDMCVKMCSGPNVPGEQLADALKFMDEFSVPGHVGLERAVLTWKIDLNVKAGKIDEAVKLAGELVGDKHWCADSFKLVQDYAAKNPPFEKVVAAARAKWNIPLPDANSPAAELLKNLTARLKDDQVRHAEEIGDELVAKHPKDDATITGIKMLVDYYYQKVLGEPRDKWMGRMIASFPHHPMTEAVISSQIKAEIAAKRYDRLAAAADTMIKNFPGTIATGKYGWYDARVTAYMAANDANGRLEYTKRIYMDMACAGDSDAMYKIIWSAREAISDTKALGDLCMEMAKKAKGRWAELWALRMALGYYYIGNYYNSLQRPGFWWDQAKEVAKAMQAQQMDPELRWRAAFMDINLDAHKGEAQAALNALNERLKSPKKFLDLSLRLDTRRIGEALGANKMMSAFPALVASLKKQTTTSRDADAIELMMGFMLEAAGDFAPAAEQYMKVVFSARWPVRMHKVFLQGLSCLWQANSPMYCAAIEKYISVIGNCQEIIPGLLENEGRFFLRARDQGMFGPMNKLESRYNSSLPRDSLAKVIQDTMNPPKKKDEKKN